MIPDPVWHNDPKTKAQTARILSLLIRFKVNPNKNKIELRLFLSLMLWTNNDLKLKTSIITNKSILRSAANKVKYPMAS